MARPNTAITPGHDRDLAREIEHFHRRLPPMTRNISLACAGRERTWPNDPKRHRPGRVVARTKDRDRPPAGPALVVQVEGACVHCTKCMVRPFMWRSDTWNPNGLAPSPEAAIVHRRLDRSVAGSQALSEDDFRIRRYRFRLRTGFWKVRNPPTAVLRLSASISVPVRLAQSLVAAVTESSLNAKPACIKVVDTFRNAPGPSLQWIGD